MARIIFKNCPISSERFPTTSHFLWSGDLLRKDVYVTYSKAWEMKKWTSKRTIPVPW
ncbi:unnamed protein product, partial [Nesidiocoris tenuis]